MNFISVSRNISYIEILWRYNKNFSLECILFRNWIICIYKALLPHVFINQPRKKKSPDHLENICFRIGVPSACSVYERAANEYMHLKVTTLIRSSTIIFQVTVAIRGCLFKCTWMAANVYAFFITIFNRNLSVIIEYENWIWTIFLLKYSCIKKIEQDFQPCKCAFKSQSWAATGWRFKILV